MAIARKWGDVMANAVNPGWLPTKTGGAFEPDNPEEGFQTQLWLVVSNGSEAMVSSRYFHNKKQSRYLHAAKDANVHDRLLERFDQLTAVHFGRNHDFRDWWDYKELLKKLICQGTMEV